MTTFIIAAITADGFIAKNPLHSPLSWRSEGDRKFFIERTKQAGLAIMGLNTALASKKPLPGRRNIIYANSKDQLPHWQEYGEWEVTQKDPKELLVSLLKDGHKEVAVCGGATIYTMFMEAGVVDTLYLSVEPILFGEGITLFNREIDARLSLISSKQLGEQAVLLEYNVVKT